MFLLLQFELKFKNRVSFKLKGTSRSNINLLFCLYIHLLFTLLVYTTITSL